MYGTDQKGRGGPARPASLVVLAVAILLALSAPMAFAARPIPWSEPAAKATPSLNCTSAATWQTAHLQVTASTCQPIFEVVYAENFSNWNSSQSYNFSFGMDWLAELSPSGAIQRLSELVAPTAVNASVVQTRHEVNLSVNVTAPVTSGAGQWLPNDTWSGSGPQWQSGNSSLGNVTVGFEFHLVNVTANSTAFDSYGVKFDVTVWGWPWKSAQDRLGLMVDALAPGGAHFTYNRSAASLTERWNSNNSSLASLVFGPSALSVDNAGTSSAVNVSAAVGLFSGGTPDRVAVALLTFNGSSGAYASLAYDPWVVFGPGLPGIVCCSPGGHHAATGVPFPMVAVALGVGGGTLFACTLAAVARKARRKPIEEGLAPARETFPPTPRVARAPN